MTIAAKKTQKNVLITGAAVRIGRALALHLAAEGWNVAIHCRTSKREAQAVARAVRALGRNAVVVAGDLAQAGAPEKIVAAAAQGLGPLTCLINNAALFKKDALHDFTDAALAAHFSVNAFAPLRLIRHFAAQCPKAGGSIVNIGDGMWGWSMSPNFLTYALSKMMLENITCLLAGELAPRVRIHTLALGPTLPGLMDKPDTFTKLARALPLQRTGTPAEVCSAVSFLLSNPSLTGQCLSLAGGADLLSPLQPKPGS